MWQDKTVSVVLMTYAERDSIRGVIEQFERTGVVDEILVVDNNSQSGTVEEVSRTTARIVKETRQGYGFATRAGIAAATGDLIVLAEPDGTFLGGDLLKFLAYSDQCDAVFGTRTHRELIWHGANMGLPLRWGNWAVAKLIRVLFNAAHLSDVGCTYRLLTRSLAEQIAPQLVIGGSQLGPELMLRIIVSGARYVEVPVNYLPRVGISSVTGDMRKAVHLGMQMVLLILKMRLQTIGMARRSETLSIGATVPDWAIAVDDPDLLPLPAGVGRFRGTPDYASSQGSSLPDNRTAAAAE